MQATLEEATLASVLDQGQCHAIGSGGIFPPAGTAEQIRLRSRQQVIAGEPRITAELLQQVQAGCGPRREAPPRLRGSRRRRATDAAAVGRRSLRSLASSP